jgi:hypothetical protein
MDSKSKYIKTRYESSCKRLLQNKPLMAFGGDFGVSTLAISPGEIDALKSVGLSVTPSLQKWDSDSLVQSKRDYMALLETSYTTNEAAKHLKVDVRWIRRRVRDGGLFSVDHQGRMRLPRFQFARGRVIPGLREVLTVLPKNLNPLDAARWFLSPNPDLESRGAAKPKSPRQWLLSGRRVDAVLELAESLGHGL